MYAKSTRPSAKREVQKKRSATIESRALGALKLASEVRDENVPAKRADFLNCFCDPHFFNRQNMFLLQNHELYITYYSSKINSLKIIIFKNNFFYNFQTTHYNTISNDIAEVKLISR